MKAVPNRSNLLPRLAFGLAAAACALAPAALGATASRVGGVVAPGDPKVDDVVCISRCVSGHRATPGATVKVKGSSLEYARRVVFRGQDGPLRARYSYRDAARVKAVVPKGAINSRPFVIDANGARSNRSPKLLEILPVTAIPKTVFPVRGPHEYWDGFGAGRGHQGADVGAACGTRLVSVQRARVRSVGYQSAAGNYVVLHNIGTNTDFGYMHLSRPAVVRKGQVVGAGRLVGYVGATGNARGCHLHFEYWRGVWYGGGNPIDPMPYLKRWDQTS